MKQTIVLASILKPVDDVRLYRKIGQSLARHYPKDSFHFIGFASSAATNPLPNVQFHPLYNFKRLSLMRFGAGWRFLRKLRQLKPNVVVVATFELLLPACIYSLFRKVTIVYDVQENYYLNVRYTRVFPVFIRLPLALVIRAIEQLAHSKVSRYLLAETCYSSEMPFMKTKSTIIANKIFPLSISSHSRIPGLLVYSGTISRAYGVFEVIDWVIRLHQSNPQIHLHIIGHCPKANEREKLHRLQKQHAFINITAGQVPVPHAQIISQLQQAHFALLPYQVNQSIQHRIPTKFYECVALQTPMLVQPNKAWQTFMKNYNAGAFVDFGDLSTAKENFNQSSQKKYYRNAADTSAIYWENEERKLLKIWQQINHSS